MSWHMSTSNTINDIHADEHGNACRSYLPWKSSHCHTQLAGCKQSQNLNGFSVRGSMPRPARCKQRLTIGASSDGVLSHSSWAACTSQDVPADAHAPLHEVTRRSELCRLRWGPRSFQLQAACTSQDVPADVAVAAGTASAHGAARHAQPVIMSLMANLYVHGGEPFD